MPKVKMSTLPAINLITVCKAPIDAQNVFKGWEIFKIRKSDSTSISPNDSLHLFSYRLDIITAFGRYTIRQQTWIGLSSLRSIGHKWMNYYYNENTCGYCINNIISRTIVNDLLVKPHDDWTKTLVVEESIRLDSIGQVWHLCAPFLDWPY